MPPDSSSSSSEEEGDELQSIQSLRYILAKSAQRPATQPTPKCPTPRPSAPVNIPPPRSSPSPNTLVLQFPKVHVPSSSPRSASPRKHGGGIWKSFCGRSPDEHAVGHGRKDSTDTLKAEKKSIVGRMVPGKAAPSAGQAQSWSTGEGASMDSPSSWVPASVAASECGPGRKEIDGGQGQMDDAPSIPVLVASHLELPVLQSPYPLPSSSPESLSGTKGSSFFKASGDRRPFDARDGGSGKFRSGITAALSSLSGTRASRVNSISWADASKPTDPAPSGNTSEQATLGSQDDDEKTSSTLSLISTVDFASPAPLPTLRAPQHRTMSPSLAAARDISPYKGSLWDPDDDEWADVDDARKVVDTFTASYRSPCALSPMKKAAPSYFQDTIKSTLLSPAQKAAEEKLRHDERVQDRVDELQNTYYSDPNGDLHDEVMKQVFLRDPSGCFASTQGPRSMHVVDLDAYMHSSDALLQFARPRLCDAVATILAHTSKACMDAFLDPAVQHFTYRREVDRSKGGLMLIVRRDGNEVVCGAYVNFGFMLQWKLYVKSRVGITGQWHEIYATTKPGVMRIDNGVPEWGVVRASPPDAKGDEGAQRLGAGMARKLELSPRKKKTVVDEHVDETSPKFMLYQSRVLARHLLWDIWYHFDQMYDCRATWEADGEEVEMRLKRELVGARDDED